MSGLVILEVGKALSTYIVVSVSHLVWVNRQTTSEIRRVTKVKGKFRTNTS